MNPTLHSNGQDRVLCSVVGNPLSFIWIVRSFSGEILSKLKTFPGIPFLEVAKWSCVLPMPVKSRCVTTVRTDMAAWAQACSGLLLHSCTLLEINVEVNPGEPEESGGVTR